VADEGSTVQLLMCRFWNRTQVQMALVEPPLSDRRPPDRQVPLSGLILARTSFASTGASFVALSINSLSPPPPILRPSRLAVAKRWFFARGLESPLRCECLSLCADRSQLKGANDSGTIYMALEGSFLILTKINSQRVRIYEADRKGPHADTFVASLQGDTLGSAPSNEVWQIAVPRVTPTRQSIASGMPPREHELTEERHHARCKDTVIRWSPSRLLAARKLSAVRDVL